MKKIFAICIALLLYTPFFAYAEKTTENSFDSIVQLTKNGTPDTTWNLCKGDTCTKIDLIAFQDPEMPYHTAALSFAFIQESANPMFLTSDHFALQRLEKTLQKSKLTPTKKVKNSRTWYIDTMDDI